MGKEDTARGTLNHPQRGRNVIQTLGHLLVCTSPAVKPSIMVAAVSS